MDVLGGGQERPPGRLAGGFAALGGRWRALPGPLRGVASALAVTLVVSGAVALTARSAPAPIVPSARPVATPPTVPGRLLLRDVPEQVVVTGGAGTRLVTRFDAALGAAPGSLLIPAPVLASRQLRDGTVVGLTGGGLFALRAGLAEAGPGADAWFPSVREDAVWMVLGTLPLGPQAVRRVPLVDGHFGAPGPPYALPPRTLPFGELPDGSLVVQRATGGDGTRAHTDALAWDPVGGAPARTIARDVVVLDVRAGLVVLRADPCPELATCPLTVVGGARPVRLPEPDATAKPLHPRSVRLDPSGRWLAYTRQLSSVVGNPLSSTGEAVVVRLDGSAPVAVPASAGTGVEVTLTWSGARLFWVRRESGPVLAVYDAQVGRARYSRRIPSATGVQTVLGVFTAPPGP